MLKTYEELRQEVITATAEAYSADHAWQAVLDVSGIDRYSKAAQQGSLREFYNAKLNADEKMRQANDAFRASPRNTAINSSH